MEEEDLIRYGRGAMYENRKRSGMSTPPVTGESSLKYFLDRLSDAKQGPYDEHILLVHNVCLLQSDIDAAKDVMKNVYWAVCPLSNIFIHNALPPVPMMWANELNVVIGTDSLSSNDDLDMVKEMYCLHENFPQVPMNEILVWASLNGARFLSKDDVLGSLTPGKRPGLVFVSNLDCNGNFTAESRSERII
jgi:cytosine/adenosine deaminase-related metal-dependent hydrolase